MSHFGPPPTLSNMLMVYGAPTTEPGCWVPVSQLLQACSAPSSPTYELKTESQYTSLMHGWSFMDYEGSVLQGQLQAGRLDGRHAIASRAAAGHRRRQQEAAPTGLWLG